MIGLACDYASELLTTSLFASQVSCTRHFRARVTQMLDAQTLRGRREKRDLGKEVMP